MFKKDNLRFGLLLGLLAPILSLVIYYFVKFYPTFSVGDFFSFVGANKRQITAISLPCLILNIALFTFYTNTRRHQTARGIFVVTLIIAIGALILKLIL
ncbi:MAG: hypothetical protein P0Y53_00415 [Candidatus Pseudobacter hemicellulosilyticus]|uniref:Stationary phase survival protein SurE n=1 Tax=Candidatus Pseudobacter hemicellulosilyticus TaxID=3121375 RepID=A0AAJ6BH62_9BACT|nr:MAG: hypothetical protein P0Y53_00415 [Pseudobacter sp.]